MKVQIISKSIKEIPTKTGGAFTKFFLFVKTHSESDFNSIVSFLRGLGCDQAQIDRFIKPREYNEEISYSFFIECSQFTFERVEKSGILDIAFKPEVRNGYINAKISIANGVEQVLSYQPPKSHVSGWACGNEPQPVGEASEVKDVESEETPQTPTATPTPTHTTAPFDLNQAPEGNDLPF